MSTSLAPASEPSGERRLAVIDMGSNTFRLVVFRYRPGGAFRLIDEIRETVRLSSGAGPAGLTAEALARAGRATGIYAAFCRSAGIDEIDAVATSAVRDAANRDAALRTLSAGGALPVRVLSDEREAWYGYLGAVNSTTLGDGSVLDVGGGSMQVTQVGGRRLERAMSRPLGAVRMTERFLSGDQTAKGELKALRRHVRGELERIGWLGDAGGRMIGIGGTVRTLAAMEQKASGYPLSELHGYVLTRDAIGGLIERMLATPVEARAGIPGLKPDRADITLAGAVSVSAGMDAAGADRLEICGQGLREGVFYERYLAPDEPPLIPDVRRASVLNLARGYGYDQRHAEHVATLAQGLYDGLAEAGVHGGDARERELLWAGAMLHDVGTLVDYNDHHKHGYYLVLNAGLPGFRHRELALVALLVRGHRKAMPEPGELAPVLADGDARSLWRLAACLRIAEQLERGRAQGVRAVGVAAAGDTVRVTVHAEGDPSIVLWSAAQEASSFERAFGRRLELAAS